MLASFISNFQIYFESWDVCSVCFIVSKIIRLQIYGIDLGLAASQRIHKLMSRIVMVSVCMMD